MTVRRILMEHWDPIGVRGDPDDEYDGYVDKVYVMIMDDGAWADEVEIYLHEVETGRMGLRGDRARAGRVAGMLVAMRPRFEAESDEPFC